MLGSVAGYLPHLRNAALGPGTTHGASRWRRHFAGGPTKQQRQGHSASPATVVTVPAAGPYTVRRHSRNDTPRAGGGSMHEPAIRLLQVPR